MFASLLSRVTAYAAAAFGKVTGSSDPAAEVRAYGTSLVRTATPLIAGALLAHLPFVARYVSSAQAQTVVALALAFVYYAVVRLLETRWPALGRLLGTPKAPSYGSLGTLVPVHVHLDVQAVADEVASRMAAVKKDPPAPAAPPAPPEASAPPAPPAPPAT